MSDTESFEQALGAATPILMDECAYIGDCTEEDDCKQCGRLMAARLKRAHDREIRDTAQREFARGMDAGQHSMDAEHRAIAMRLRHLPLDGGSHENLSQIAHAVYHADFGWTQGACASLRDELVRLMGGVSDGCCCAGGGACAAGDGGDSGEQEVTDERVADDCGADSRGGDGGGAVHMAGVSIPDITDELRKFAMTYKNVWRDDSGSIIYTTSDFPPTEDAMSMMNCINEIADHMDARFNWAMISRSSELGCYKLRINQLESECDELRAKLDEAQNELQRGKWEYCETCEAGDRCDQLQEKLDEYDRTHVELPRDANGEVFRVDGGAKVDDLVLTIRQMTLTKSGWKIRAYDEDYEVEREASFFDACAPKPDIIEETIEKLTLGEITQTEAIERIKSFHGTARGE